MNRVQSVENQVKELSLEELETFRLWFAEYDAEIWDRQFEADVNAGKLAGLADRALRDHAAGKTTKL